MPNRTSIRDNDGNSPPQIDDIKLLIQLIALARLTVHLFVPEKTYRQLLKARGLTEIIRHHRL